MAFQDQRFKVSAGGVNSGCETGAASAEDDGMANLTLIYGMRLLPSEEAIEVGDALVTLKNGKQAHVTMHVLEGSREEIENQLRQSIEAFFDFYPEI
jgi:hypothetical protein